MTMKAPGLLRPVCQSCGKEIMLGNHIKRVTYGALWVTGHPHYAIHRTAKDDYFHRDCDGAFRE